MTDAGTSVDVYTSVQVHVRAQQRRRARESHDMVNLSTAHMRYLTPDDFRVLGAVDSGSKTHEIVPVKLIHQLSGIRSPAAVDRCISTLAKAKLIGKLANRQSYDGYRLTGMGADHLAMRALAKRGSLHSMGNQIGVGKEADVYACTNDAGDSLIVKFHRLGRTSFRNAARNNRDYRRGGSTRGRRFNAGSTSRNNTDASSWTYLSRLSAEREYAFMCALQSHGFPIPTPVDRQRHCVVMALIDAFPLHQIEIVLDPAKLVDDLLAIAVRFARHGLVHGDFNEFNILVHEDGTPVVIDFPQMISIDHADAAEQFHRDVTSLYAFFRRKFNYEHDRAVPSLAWALSDAGRQSVVERAHLFGAGTEIEREEVRIDRLVMASGAFSKRQIEDLERAMRQSRLDDGADATDASADGSGDEDEQEEGEDENENVNDQGEEQPEFTRDIRS